MGNLTPESSSTKPSTAAAKDRVGRRSFLFSGMIGGTGVLVGGAGGFAAGYKTRPAAVEETEVEKEQRTATKASYSQFGEDLVLKSLCVALRLSAPSYLDIGAYEPILSNNTYLFYGRGARGVLVEPNVSLTDKLRRLRPDDTVLTAGIGIDDRAEADYYVMRNPELNTFDKDQVALLERAGERPEKVVKMPLVNINRVIAEHFNSVTPDIISIDIEGLDYAVLKTLDYGRFRPKIICAETVITTTLQHNLNTPKLMAEKGYELRGMTHPNMIFVDKALLGKA